MQFSLCVSSLTFSSTAFCTALMSILTLLSTRSLWKTVRGIGTPTLLLNVIKNLYSFTHSRVQFGKSLSHAFQTTSVARQGSVLVPTLVEPLTGFFKMLTHRLACYF